MQKELVPDATNFAQAIRVLGTGAQVPDESVSAKRKARHEAGLQSCDAAYIKVGRERADGVK